jgi:hypothetical protein
MARTVLPIAGAVIGFYFGGAAGAQWGYAAGSLIAGAIPQQAQGPRIGETGAQTSQEGAPRAIVFGTCQVTGNVIASGPLIKRDVEENQGGKGGTDVSSEHAYRTYAVRLCEGPVAAFLRIWEDDKLVYDVRTGSTMVEESWRWASNKVFYMGGEDQLPDPNLQIIFGVNEVPAHRGSAYFVAIEEDLTDRRGSIKQYRAEVARQTTSQLGDLVVGATSTGAYGTYLTLDAEDYPLMLTNQTGTGGAPEWTVGNPGTYSITKFEQGFTLIGSSVINNAGDSPGDLRLAPIAIDDAGRAISFDGNFGYCKLIAGGVHQALLKPDASAPDSWWYAEGSYFPEYGGLVWFYGTDIYIGVRKTSSASWDSIYRFPAYASGTTYALSSVSGVTGDISVPVFWMHVSTTGVVRSIAHNSSGTMQVFNSDLSPVGSVVLPSGIAARFPSISAIRCFGVDDSRGLQCYVAPNGSSLAAFIYDMSGALKATYPLPGVSTTSVTNRVVFGEAGIYIQCHHQTFLIEAPPTYDGVPMVLADVVAEIHDRCNFPSAKRNVSELTDIVTGLVLAGDYTGADAINTLRSLYLFDAADQDKTIVYPKRGKAVVATITEDDIVEAEESTKREQAIEYPKKLHLSYQNAVGGYAVGKATSTRSSPDVRVVGEVSASVPVVLDPDQAAQAAQKMHKIAWAEAEGETKLSVPLSWIKYIASDCFGVALRGRVTRERMDELNTADGVIEYTLRRDRQSAYTSQVTGIPIPEPTPPPPTIVGEAVLAVLDISPRADNEDDLNLLYAVSGGLPAWNGATVQRSLDGGANYTSVVNINRGPVVGSLVNPLAAASEFYTDRTNVLRVQLYRDTQTIESISDAQFLSEGGGFAVQRPDGSWEVMQYRDAAEVSAGVYDLSYMHRGQLNSGASSHLAGALFVMLADAVKVSAQSSWIGTDLTHRAVSYGESPETADEQTESYVGRSQIEWPVAYLQLSRDVSNNVTGSWTPRHRLGTEDVPVASINFRGYRVTLNDGVLPAVTFDTTAQSFTYAAGALGTPLTVSVAALNRITGAGPATSGSV